MLKDGVDPTMVEGAATLPYAIPNLQVSAAHRRGRRADPVVAVGGLHAHRLLDRDLPRRAGGRSRHDPLEIRQELLEEPSAPLGVLNLAAEKAGWGTPLPRRPGARHRRARVLQVLRRPGGRGLAWATEGLPKVDRVVCAVDCGIAINPDIVRAQMEGGIGYGLSAGPVRRRSTSSDGRVRAVELPRLPRRCASTRCRRSRCTSCPRARSRPASASPACRRSRPPSPTRGAKLTGQRIRDLPFRALSPRHEERDETLQQLFRLAALPAPGSRRPSSPPVVTAADRQDAEAGGAFAGIADAEGARGRAVRGGRQGHPACALRELPPRRRPSAAGRQQAAASAARRARA